ncbi:MAG: hypothetical protein O2858_10500 [Proteobacteria bacterium]|jgi:uncharacterized membrane protein YkoI|nr:hypothetical protein [Pseudomonadota bacterium]
MKRAVTRISCGWVALLLAASLGAAPYERQTGKPQGLGAERQLVGAKPFAGPARGMGQKIDNQGAARLVKQRFGDRRILGIKLVERGVTARYRIKTLSREGVVAFVYVDAETGTVSE